MTVLRVALAQLNPTVGDLDGNLAKIVEAYGEADRAGCDIVAFPELSITGYPPEDLVMKPGFVADNERALAKFAALTGRCAAVIGFVEEDRDLFNAAAVCAGGDILGTYRKRLLPNYAVFDEARYFTPGNETDPLELYVIGGVKVGISICEDVWSPDGPLAVQADGGAELAVNINASPYHRGKAAARERMLATRAADAHSALVYVNQVGGQDELVFDGCSLAFDAEGTLVARGPQFAEHLLVVDVPVPPVFRQRMLDPRGRISQISLPLVVATETPVAQDAPAPPSVAVHLDPVAELYAALVLGTKDYCAKNGFSDVVIGLSGGIDSTLVAVIAADALGADHVHGVSMPSRYSSDHSRSDAAALAANLGLDYRTISIEPAFAAYLEMLEDSFAGREPGLTQENIQSRCRGQLLMALSNEFGWMVLTTGNKSEMAVGYFTIYGDSVGGYAVIKDVLKTEVYALCRYVNERAGREVIPEAVITKPPSAELRPDQRDDQSLPPYDVLDPILELYVEEDFTAGEIVEQGHAEDVVRRVTRLVDIAEYKRRQCPPGVRVTTKAFGRDRRMPITNGYR
ncbi:MAG: NAD+ synthase [Actinomycetota bacterium]|nr:NAD+ synthase [Actinomycetota bacterium]